MRAKSVSLKEIVAVVAAVVVNAFILSQVVGGVSSNQPTSAFAQPYQDGDPCTDPGQCTSNFCEQGVCCATACNGTNQICNSQTNPGVCTAVLGAPSLSWPGQFLAATLLTLLGWFGLRRMRKLN